MQKNQNAKLLTALGLMLVLAISPLAVVNAQTSIGASTDASVSANATTGSDSASTSSSDDDRKDKVREKAKKRLTELRDRHTERDFRPTIAFTGETEGWGLIGGIAHKSSISLHDGKAAKVGEHQWRLATSGTISVGDKTFDIHLKGKAQGTKKHAGIDIVLHGTVIVDGIEHKIALAGVAAPTSDDNTFALAFTKLGFKGERYHFLQVGKVVISPLSAANISPEQSQKDMASFRASMSVE